ncbi:MAG: cupin domain-containing protein [Desulfobacterales bacterium]|nr:cupin domain-containing protein [Desulfobacterales bacterium]
MNTERIRVSTGVGELDPILGGLLIGDNVIWYDDAGSLAGTFTLNFLQSSIAQEKPFIYVSFDRSPRNLLEKLGPLAESPRLTILDCFTHGKGKGAEIFLGFYENLDNSPCKVVRVTEPHDPDKVMDCFLEIHESTQSDLRFVFESLTGMQDLWQGEDRITSFYTHTCPRLFELNTVGYWIAEKNAHSRRLKAAINQIAQVAVELSLRRGKTSLSILKAENREIDTLNTPYYYWAQGLNISFVPKKQATGRVEIGTRIRTLRTRRGLSQTELARLVGVTPSNISQIESNQIYPSLPALIKMSEILSVEMSAFFEESGSAQQRIIFPAADAAKINLPDMPEDSVSAKLMTSLDAGGRAEPFVVEIHPGATLPSHFFVHKGEEIGYVLSGRLQLKLGAATSTARAGDLIYLKSEMPSQWENPGAAPARLLWIKIK